MQKLKLKKTTLLGTLLCLFQSCASVKKEPLNLNVGRITPSGTVKMFNAADESKEFPVKDCLDQNCIVMLPSDFEQLLIRCKD